MEDGIVNRVEQSGLVQINLDEFYPSGERISFDLKDGLHEGLILIEKEFRDFVHQTDWSDYEGKYVHVFCSQDAIIPLWAFMLLTSHLKPVAKKVVMGTRADLETAIFNDIFDAHDFSQYDNKNVIVKGCGKHPIPEPVFVEFTNRLQDHAKKIMFGEACSAVPLFKR
ncbi:MAG: DUF2480 family protein [Flavobacteriales bacterium]|nr:DUF2480 family protein [Flavobacteriales bacterium]